MLPQHLILIITLDYVCSVLVCASVSRHVRPYIFSSEHASALKNLLTSHRLERTSPSDEQFLKAQKLNIYG